MSSTQRPFWGNSAIRVVSAGLGAAVAGPLGGALGGWLGEVLGATSGHLAEKYAEEFGEKGGEKFLELLTDRLTGMRDGPPPSVERVWRGALRLSLAAIRDHVREKAFESWFVNWEACLASSAPLNLASITADSLAADGLDQLFEQTMQRLDSQGTAVREHSLSLTLPLRPIPPALLAELNARLPELLQATFRALIVKPENDEARHEMELAVRETWTGILGRIEQNTALLPGISGTTTEIHRLVQDELLRQVAEGRSAQDLLVSEVHKLRDQIGGSQTVAAPAIPARLWLMPERNSFFSGRSAYLENLRERLTQSGAAAVTQKRSHAISGMGGMGKTQTAVEYAHRYPEHYTAGFFVLADSPEAVERSFANLARLAGEPRDLPDTELAARAKAWLEDARHAGWLLILDNVDDVAHVKNHIPTTGGHVLITTRLNSVGRLAGEIELPRMEAAEGAIFLLKRAEFEDGRGDPDLAGAEGHAALELSTMMAGLPLALEQAGAYIREMSSSPSEYLRFYREEGVNLLGRPAADSDHDSVLVTFHLAFDRLSEPARAAVRLCSLLAPEGIPEEVIIGKEPTRSAREAIGEAARYSLLTIRRARSAAGGVETRTVDIHRLVQDVVRSRMSDAERQAWVDRALRAVNQTVFTSEGIEQRQQRAGKLLSERFAAYSVQGMDSWPPLDPVPYIISPQEWRRIEKAIAQRATLFDALLADAYGPRRLTEVIPAALLHPDFGYSPQCAGLPAANGRHLRIYAASIVRIEDGSWVVVEDATSVPSGLSLALENRAVLSRVVPETAGRFEIRSLKPFFEEYLAGIRDAAPQRRNDPHVVMLSPGRYNSAHFEHAYLAHQCQFTLVEGRDLFANLQGVFQHTVSGPRPVDVIVRRIDTDFADPEAFRQDSLLGVPGLVQAVRRGQVAVINTLGSQFADRPVLRPFLDRLCRLFLGEGLLMPTIPTWWCGDPQAFEYVKAHLDELLIFNLSPGIRQEMDEDAARLLQAIGREPQRYLAQARLKPLPLSGPAPENGRETFLQFRVFACAVPGGYSVMPGGLSWAGDRRTGFGSSRGAMAKDTWVIGDREPGPAFEQTQSLEWPGVLSLRLADSYFWLGRYLERLDFSLRSLARLRAGHQPNGDATGHTLEDQLEKMGVVAHPGGDGAASIPEMICAAEQDEQNRGSMTQIVRSIVGNAHAVELFLPRAALRSISDLNAALSKRLANPPDSPAIQEMEASLQMAAAAIAEFRKELEHSNWRDTGWRLLSLGHSMESFYRLREMLADHEGETAQAMEAQLFSEARRIAEQIKSLPANGALRTSLEQAAAVLDQAAADRDRTRAYSSIDAVTPLLEGTFIAGPATDSAV